MASTLNQTRVIYDPSPVQAEFHALKVDEALFGGAAGPGKSAALRADPIQCGLIIQEHERKRQKQIEQSRATVLNLRRTMPMHEESFARAKELYYALDSGFKVVDQKSRYVGTFSSGLKMIWGHLKDDDAFQDHRSAEYVRINWDELNQFEAEQYDQMQTRIRTSDPQLEKFLGSRGGSNPDPGWLRTAFVDPAPPRTVMRRKLVLEGGYEAERSRIFIPALLRDHPSQAFRLQYEARLRSRPKHIQAALLNGDWYVIAGAFFADVWDPDAVVIKPFKIPAHWTRFRAMDWGLKSECVVLWVAISPDGELIVYRERTFNGKKAKRFLSAYEVALEIKDIEMSKGEWNRAKDCSKLTGPADTQLWEDRGQKGPTMAHDMASIGVHWKKATKGRRQAAQQVYKRLGTRPRPGLMFFDTCLGCISTIPALSTDASDQEVPAKGGPDHWYDTVSYACAQHVHSSEEVADTTDDDDDEDDNDELAARRIWGRCGYGKS